MLKIAIKIGRDCPLVIWSTTRLYLKEKNKEALNIVTQGLQNYQNDLEGLSLLSTCLRVNNRYDSSIEICKKILNIDYRNVEANLNLGLINLSLNSYSDAQKHLEIVYEEKEHLYQVWPLLSSLYLKKNYIKALPLYLKLFEAGKKNVKFHIDLTHLHPKILEKIKIN